MNIYLLLAILFGVGIVSNLLDQPIDWTEVASSSTIVLLLLFMLFWIRASHRRAHRTLEWLLENKDLITDQPQYFRDGPIFDKSISTQTKLRSFKVVTSAFILTTVSELGLEIRSGIWAGLFATTWTLLFGWWGLPWGPVRTLQALSHNLSGGKTISVAGVIISAETGWNFETGKRES